MSIAEFSQKYFNFKNNWHHLFFYDLMEDNLLQINGKFYLKGRRYYDKTGRHYVKTKIENRRFLILSPRYSAKSTIVSFIYPLYLICHNPNIRILVVSANEDIATSFVRQVLYQLENNEKLLKDYHYLIPKKYNKWGEKAFIVKRDTIEKDPTMSSAGLLGKIVSKRADVIILDDIIDLNSSRTSSSRKKVLEWFDNVLYPILEPNSGKMFVVGTSWFRGDLYDVIEKERDFDVKVKLKSFISYVSAKDSKSKMVRVARFNRMAKEPLALNIRSILSKEVIEKYWEHGLEKSVADGSLWSDKWNYERLQKQRQLIGETAFCRQYLNEPVSAIDSFFSKASIDRAFERGKSIFFPPSYPIDKFFTIPSDMIVAMGVDLALSTEKSADYSAIAIWGLSSDKRRYLLHLSKLKKPIQEVKEKIIELYHLFHPLKVIVESNVFQDIIRQELGEEIDVEGIKTTAISKFDEVRGLGHMQTLFDQDKIIIPNHKNTETKTRELIASFYNELLQVRLDEKSHTPDTIMASWFALQFLKNYDELIAKSSGFFTVDGIAYQSKKLVHSSQYTVVSQAGQRTVDTIRFIPSYNSIFYSFIKKDEILKREYFVFATYIKTRVLMLFFDKWTGELCLKIDGTITPTFAAEWISKRSHIFKNPPIAVYKDYDGATLLYELQNNNYPSLFVSYPKEDGLPSFGLGVPPLPYVLSPAFEHVRLLCQHKKTLSMKDKGILLDFSRIITVSGSEVVTSKTDDIPQKALTFALGHYLWYYYNREEKKEKNGEKISEKFKIKYKPPHYTIFNYDT